MLIDGKLNKKKNFVPISLDIFLSLFVRVLHAHTLNTHDFNAGGFFLLVV